jgi:D-glycero-alpha-D-manno-heptose-7-phosphate kinase
MKKFSNVYVRAPLRLSLAGGGCDFPVVIDKYSPVSIISCALSSFVHVNVRYLSDLFDEKYRLEYYNVEHCNSRAEIKNDIIRGVFELLDWELPVHISTVSDIPASSGLGSSSTFCVALIHALRVLRGDEPIHLEPNALAKDAVQVELDILKRPMGIQDALPAAYGGSRIYTLKSKYEFDGAIFSSDWLCNLIESGCLYMVWIGGQRGSESVLGEQISNVDNRIDAYSEMAQIARDFGVVLDDAVGATSKTKALLVTLTRSKTIKDKMSSRIYTKRGEQCAKLIERNNIFSYRVMGAGNGGFILVCDQLGSKALRSDLEKNDFKVFVPGLSKHGSKLIFGSL